MSKTCAWPGCSTVIQTDKTRFCGHHQLALSHLVKNIHHGHPIGSRLSATSKARIAWAIGPTILPSDPPRSFNWYIPPSISKSDARKIMSGLGVPDRTFYYRVSSGQYHCHVDGSVELVSLIEWILMEHHVLSVPEVAEEIGTSHRYLRHLLYETKREEITKFSIPSSQKRWGMDETCCFLKDELLLIKQAFLDIAPPHTN